MLDQGNTKIGTLADITGEYFTARLIADSGASSMAGVRSGHVGSYLSVKQSNSQILVMVERSYRVTDGQGQAAYVVRLTPVGELSFQGTYTSGISTFPSVGDEVHLVPQDQLAGIFSKHSDGGFKAALAARPGNRTHPTPGGNSGPNAARVLQCN